MSPFVQLPSEILLQILEPLRIPDIHAFRIVCKHFDAIIIENSTSIYRHTAFVHGYISPRSKLCAGELLQQAVARLYDLQSTIDSWLDFCRARWRIDQAWKKGNHPPEFFHETPLGQPRRLYRQGDTLLVSPENRRGFGAINALETLPSRFHVDWTSPDTTGLLPHGELILADEHHLLFKIRPTHFRVWKYTPPIPPSFESFIEALEVEDDASVQTSYSAGLKLIGDVNLDGRQNGVMMKDGCLMISTERNTLYVFDLQNSEYSQLEPALTPSGIVDLWSLRSKDTLLQQNVGFTTCLDFSERYIFHCTTERVRVLCRKTYTVLYSMHEASWRKVALGRWGKCITSNVFHIAPPTMSRPGQQWARVTREDVLEDHFVPLQRGSAPKRKDSPWRWDVIQMVYAQGTLVMSFGGGWIVCIPDVKALVEGRCNLEDEKACWVLDIGAAGSDVLFDGRRIVWNHFEKTCILNLHESEMQVGVGTSIVRLSQLDWSASTNAHTMILTDKCIWFLGFDREDVGTNRLVHWVFGE